MVENHYEVAAKEMERVPGDVHRGDETTRLAHAQALGGLLTLHDRERWQRACGVGLHPAVN